MPLIRACTETDLGPGETLKIDLAPPIALFRTDTGWHALDDTCTHGMASLSEGFFDGDVIECPLHMGQFSLRTGKPLCPPLSKPVRVYPVVITDGDVFIDVDR